MTNFISRENAIKLRLLGKSYSQIKKTLKVSKSTLSYWLRNYPLSEKQVQKLKNLDGKRIEKYRKTMQTKREERLKNVYQQQKKHISPFLKNKNLLYLLGLFLYWGEGTKKQMYTLSVSNTDPAVIKFFVSWFVKILSIPKNKIKIQLHLYNDMNIKQECLFWKKTLNIPLNQFNKSYIKKSSISRINHKNDFNHGTCNISVNGARTAEKILMAIKFIRDHYYLKNIGL